MEIGSNQGDSVPSLLEASGAFEAIEVVYDYAKHPRLVQGKRSQS